MFLVWFRALWGATMGCFASKGAGPGAYEVSKLADAFEDRKQPIELAAVLVACCLA